MVSLRRRPPAARLPSGGGPLRRGSPPAAAPSAADLPGDCALCPSPKPATVSLSLLYQRDFGSHNKSGLNNFGAKEPSTSGGGKHIGRKNNDHWTEDEVRQLVKGISFYGVGKWSHVKRKYFKASIRTSVHLKDKWKNLVKACKKENGRMLLHLEQSLIEHIKEIDANDPYPKQSNSDEGD